MTSSALLKLCVCFSCSYFQYSLLHHHRVFHGYIYQWSDYKSSITTIFLFRRIYDMCHLSYFSKDGIKTYFRSNFFMITHWTVCGLALEHLMVSHIILINFITFVLLQFVESDCITIQFLKIIYHICVFSLLLLPQLAYMITVW